MNISLFSGPLAQEWIGETSNISAWRELYKAVGCRQTYLSPEFCQAWYEHYADRYELVIVSGHDTNGNLCALMPLARHNNSLTGAGAAQAEYQGWLSQSEYSEAFFRRGLEAIGRQFPGENLILKYVLPGTGAETLSAFCRQNRNTRLVRHERPVIDADLAAIRNSLKKKSNRSKLNRLKKLGDLRLSRVSGESEFGRLMDPVFAAYDLRQGAKNNTCPFFQDSAKRAFHQSWFAACPSDLYVSVLTMNERPISGFFGVVVGETLANAIVSYEPDVASHSASKLHIYMLLEELAEAGFASLDLTPGGDTWKQRFAARNEEAVEFTYWAQYSALRRQELSGIVRKRLKSFASVIGLTPATVQSLRAQNKPTKPSIFLKRLGNRLYGRSEKQLYRLETSQIDRTRAITIAAVNSATDLVSLACSMDNVPRKQYLATSFDRLSQGQKSYTVRHNNRVSHCGWVATDQTSSYFDDVKHEYMYPDAVAVIHDIRQSPPEQSFLVLKDLIKQALSDVRSDKNPPEWVYAAIGENDTGARQALEACGFLYQESIIHKSIFFKQGCNLKKRKQALSGVGQYPNTPVTTSSSNYR